MRDNVLSFFGWAIILLLALIPIAFFGAVLYSGIVGTPNPNDTITMFNRTSSTKDNIIIETPENYFYKEHELYRVDNDTLKAVIYFTDKEVIIEDDKEWKDENSER